MSRKKDYLQAIITCYLDDIAANEKINIDTIIMDNLLHDNELSEGLEMINKKINDISSGILPTMPLEYKLANLSVGKSKTIKIELLNSHFDPSTIFHIDSLVGLEEIGGILWNRETESLEGIPENDGTFQLEVLGTFKSSKGYTRKTKGFCKLTVVPDPKSLWKTLEPDESIPYKKAHEDSKCLTSFDNSRLLYASKRGRSHAHAGSFRDDDGEILIDESGWSILVIADGGGSYSLSRRGSEIAVEKSSKALEKILSGEKGSELEKAFFNYEDDNSDELKNILDSKLKETIVSAAYTGYKAIESEAKDNNKDVKDYSTTLLMAAHKKTLHGQIVLTFWVGDGVISLYSKGKKVTLLGEPDSGEFAGQTRFLDESFFYDTNRVQMRLVHDFTALILLTDGVSDPFFDTNKALNNVDNWDQFWELISKDVVSNDVDVARLKLLEWLDFWVPGNHDDRTIALLIPLLENDNTGDESTLLDQSSTEMDKDNSLEEKTMELVITYEDNNIVSKTGQVEEDIKDSESNQNDTPKDEEFPETKTFDIVKENESEENEEAPQKAKDLKDNDNNG